MSWFYLTPEGQRSSTMPSAAVAKAEAVKFSWVRAFANAGMHADFASPDAATVEEEFPELAKAGWSVIEEK